MQEGRKNPTRKDTPQANPFSRFFSAFSVEPQYPEHKRSYARAAGGDVTDLHDDSHMVKKLKESSTDDAWEEGGSSSTDDRGSRSGRWTGFPMAVAATAVAVVAVVLALRPKK